MSQHRVAARWFAGMLSIAALAVGGLTAPAQAVTSHSGHISQSHYRPADTGWNGT